MRVLTVVGNRPQFIKAAPLAAALRSAGIDEVVLHTGQHYDRELSGVFFDELGLDEPAYRLGVESADPSAMVPGIRAAIAAENPDWVVVLGDTNSTLAGAQAAGDTAIAHVEAGLRSFDLSMPEERNRIAVDRLSTLLLCPDERSAAQLASEGIAGKTEVVGDVMADAIRLFEPLARERITGVLARMGAELPERADLSTPVALTQGEFRLLTIHREANVEPERLRRLVSTINGLGGLVVFPAHPRTRWVMEANGIRAAPYVLVTEPLGHLDMLALVLSAAAVVTDSGGLQKEAYWLKTPCVTLRASTEWVDTVAAGANTLLDPANLDESTLGSALLEARFPDNAPQLYGDGHASERIAAALYASGP